MLVEVYLGFTSFLRFVIFNAMAKVYIGEILVREGLITSKQLAEALKKQKSYPNVMLGDVLVLMGYVTPEKLKKALRKQFETAVLAKGDLFGVEKISTMQEALIELLIEKNVMTKEELMRTVDKIASKD